MKIDSVPAKIGGIKRDEQSLNFNATLSFTHVVSVTYMYNQSFFRTIKGPSSLVWVILGCFHTDSYLFTLINIIPKHITLIITPLSTTTLIWELCQAHGFCLFTFWGQPWGCMAVPDWLFHAKWKILLDKNLLFEMHFTLFHLYL